MACDKKETKAFSEALALESIGKLETIPKDGLWKCDSDALVRYAKTIAYKVFHNLKNGHPMDKDDDPLVVNGDPAMQAWSHHYDEQHTLTIDGKEYEIDGAVSELIVSISKERDVLKAVSGFKVTVGPEGLDETWQAKFPETVKCDKCGGEARHGFTAMEGYSGTPGEGHVCDLHENGGKGDYWLHDCCAVAVYFCKDCLKASALNNQG